MDLSETNILSQQKRQLLRFIGWLTFANAIVFMIIGHIYLKSILYSVSLFKATTFKYVFLKKCYILFFAIVNYLTYMGILASLPALLLLLLAVFIPHRPLIWTASIIMVAINVGFLLMDTQLYTISEFHLNSTILDYVFSKKIIGFFDFSNREVIQIIIYIVLIILSEVILVYIIWNKIILTRRFIRIGKHIFILYFCGFLFCYVSLLGTTLKGSAILSQQSVYLPYYDAIFKHIVPANRTPYHGAFDLGQDVFATLSTIRPMNYPLNPMQCEQSKNPYNIIFILVDTLRSDMLTEQFMPKTTAFSKKNWVFINHNSGGNSTFSGLTSLIYSIPGTYFSSLLSQKIPPALYGILKNNHYNSKVIWSASMFSNEIFKIGLSSYSVEDSDNSSDVSYRDRMVTQKGISFLNENKGSSNPFFITLFYDSVHAFCRKQSIPFIYGNYNASDCSRISLDNDADPKPFYNRYLNTVNFADGEISRVLEVIEKNGYLDNSIVVITADHGQQFNETKLNAWWHGTNFTHYQIKVPFIIHWPNTNPRTFSYSTTHYDLMPTLFEDVFSCKNPISDYSIGQNLLNDKGRMPFELVAGYFNMGVIEKNEIISLTVSGQEVTTKITDKQGYPLPNAKPDEAVIKKAVLLFMSKYFAPKH